MRKTATVLFAVILVAELAIAQMPAPSANLLGAHNVGGRGCLTCHAPSSGSSSAAPGAQSDEIALAPWGPSTIPLYGKTIAFGDGGRYVDVFPTDISVTSREVIGVLVCLSCHDGNLTPPSMMVGQSFEQRIGLLPGPAYGGQPIPTLLGSDNYANDHPVGPSAVIREGEGLVWIKNTFTVVPGSRYAQFLNNYGWPALVPGRSSNPGNQSVWTAFRSLHHVPQPAHHDRVRVFALQPDCGRWRRQNLCNLLLRERTVQSQPQRQRCESHCRNLDAILPSVPLQRFERSE